MKRTILGQFRRSVAFGYVCRQCRNASSLPKVFKEGDRVVLKEDGRFSKVQLVRKPLTHGESIQGHQGALNHDDIIGRTVIDVVKKTASGTRFTVHEPTLAEYVTLTNRLVAPIYPDDANVIVKLLELHPEPPSPQNEGDARLELFECGTGHGALTLHLSRAIHAANSAPPMDDAELEEWKYKRRAIIHSMDISQKHSLHAQKVVKGFRGGMYYGNVDFSVGEPASFFRHRDTDAPFLSHAILDMPGANKELATVTPFVHIGGLVLLFVPSITQLIEAQKTVLKHQLPLLQEQILELGPGMSGGREWSIKLLKPRAKLRAEAEALGTEFITSDEASDMDADVAADRVSELVTKNENDELVSVCRPKVARVVQGGGFIGLWRRVASREGVTSDSGYRKGFGRLT